MNTIVDDCGSFDVAVTTPEMVKAPNVQTKLAHRRYRTSCQARLVTRDWRSYVRMDARDGARLVASLAVV